MMNGADLKKAAINKAKQVVDVAHDAATGGAGNNGKKRRKGGDLKPIITTESPHSEPSSPMSATTPQNIK